MKIKKLLIVSTPIIIPSLMLPALSSCGEKEVVQQCTINFSASEGITLSSSKPINVNKGVYWSDLIKEGKIPTVSYESTCTALGWCVVDDQDNFTSIESDIKIESNMNVKFIGYDNVQHPLVDVEVNYSPTETPVGLEFAAGLTFKSFRSYYNFPETPTLEGYEFEGYYDGESNPISDSYKFPKTASEIQIKWNPKICTLTLDNDGNGTVTAKSNYFQYGKTWKQIKEDLEIKPVPNIDYEFLKWVDKYNDDISDDYVIKKGFYAKALFKKIEYQQLVFTCTDNTYFDGGYIKVTKNIRTGMTWQDVINAGDIIPTPIYPSECTAHDWYVVSQSGSLEKITNDYIFTEKTNLKFIAYNPADYEITVTFVYGPNKSVEYKELKYLKGAKFGDFRSYYNIPETSTYEGYEFVGYYTGEDHKWEDEDLLPDQAELTIIATYTQIKHKVYISCGDHGQITSTTELIVPYGSKWGDVKQSITYKADDGYSFEKWVFLDGTTISDDYVITSVLNVKALFSTSKCSMSLSNVKSVSVNTTEHGSSVNVQYSELVDGSSGGKEAYTYPTLTNGKLHFENQTASNDLRFITGVIKVSVPVQPHTTRSYSMHIEIKHQAHYNAYIGTTDLQTTFELFNLNSQTDHPTFYANCKGSDDTRASDEKSIYRVSQKDHTVPWSAEDVYYNSRTDAAKYQDVNDNDNVIWVNHFIGFSFLVEGNKVASNGKQMHYIDAQISLVDA